MLIIIEGPDGAGKSTLARDLAVELRLRETVQRYDGHERVVLLHRGPPIAHPLDEYEIPLHDYRPDTGAHIICDRWHLGELVYPDLVNRRTRYDPAVHRHVDLFLRSRGALIVGLTPAASELEDRLRVRPVMSSFDELTLGATARLLDRYETSYDLCTTRVLRTVGAAPVSEIIELAGRLERDAVPLAPFITYVGPPAPHILLFGEVRGVGGSHATGPAPAFVPYPGTSGHYLLSHLDTLGRWSVGLANACDVDDPVTLWKTLGSPLTVTLGAVAHRRLTELGVPHGAAPHPQFVRRFHHREGHRYAEVIRRAARHQEDMSSWRP